MYQTTLYFNLKTPEGNPDTVLRMFFEDWADQICDREVSYTMVAGTSTIRVDFVKEEDAIAMKLKGIPDEFKNYLTLV